MSKSAFAIVNVKEDSRGAQPGFSRRLPVEDPCCRECRSRRDRVCRTFASPSHPRHADVQRCDREGLKQETLVHNFEITILKITNTMSDSNNEIYRVRLN